jgi:hypothetical protein
MCEEGKAEVSLPNEIGIPETPGLTLPIEVYLYQQKKQQASKCCKLR